MTPKPESETDPWKAIQRYELVQTNFAYTTDHEMERDAEGEWARWEAVEAVRAAEAAQHQQAISRLTRQAQDISVTLGEAGCRAMPIVDGVRWLVDHNLQLRARAAVEAERDMLNGALEAAPDEGILSRTIDNLAAERDRLKAALQGVMPFIATQAMACGGMKCREMWCESCFGEDEAREFAQAGADAMGEASAALTTQGQSTDGETR